MDQLRAMRVFARVIDEGGFARAANAMNIAPAVATRLVAELEEHLGARLIHRTTRRLTLTDVGESYLERVRVILSDLDDAEAAANAATAEPRGTLRVLAPPGFSAHALAHLLPGFRQRCPRVDLELTISGTMAEAADDNHDVTIVVAKRPLDGGFVARMLACSELVLCGSPAYFASRGAPQRPEDLVGHDALLPVPPAVRRELEFTPAAGGASVKVELVKAPALATTHTDTMYAAALAGLGIAGLPSFVAAQALNTGRLQRVLPHWRLATLPVVAAMPTRKHVPVRTRSFIDYLVERLGGEMRDPWLTAAGCETCP